MAYFEAHCAGCHGPDGMLFAPGMDERHPGPDLAHIIDEMAAGPGMAPIDGPDLEAQVAFHRSLIDGRPFLAWTGQSGDAVAGEVTRGSRVRVLTPGGEAVDAEIDGFRWTANAAGQGLVVEAAKGDATTTLHLNDAPHSHGHQGSGSSQ